MIARLMKWAAAPLVLAAVTAVPASAQECQRSSGYDREYGTSYRDSGYYGRGYDRGDRVRADIHVSLGRVISRLLRDATRDDRSSRYYSRDHRRSSDSHRHDQRRYDSRDSRDSYDWHRRR